VQDVNDGALDTALGLHGVDVAAEQERGWEPLSAFIVFICKLAAPSLDLTSLPSGGRAEQTNMSGQFCFKSGGRTHKNG
jgi:hypothetical protein